MRSRLFLLALAALASSVQAAVINFDNFLPGTVLTNAIPGLTFREPRSNGTLPITVVDLGNGNKVLSLNGNVAFSAAEGAVDVLFSVPQRSVSIDAAAFREHYYYGVPLNRPFLEAYDAAGALIAKKLYQGPLPSGGAFMPFETLSIVSSSANIARIRFSSQASQGGSVIDGVFDNLAYSLSTTPNALWAEDFGRHNFKRWVQSTQGTGIDALVTGGELVFDVNPSIQGADVWNRWDLACALTGDFDLRVDYRMKGTQSGVRAALAAWGAGHVERSSLSKSDIYTAGDYYITNISGYVPGFVPTTDGSGSLRLVRTGSQMTSYYMSAGSGVWTAIYTQWVTSADVPVGLQVWTHDWAYARTGAQVSFDNLVLVGGRFATRSGGC